MIHSILPASPELTAMFKLQVENLKNLAL